MSSNPSTGERPVLDPFVGDRGLAAEPTSGPDSDNRRPEMEGAASVVALEEDCGRIEAEEKGSGASEVLGKGAVGCSDKEPSFEQTEEAMGIQSKEGEDAVAESKEAKSIGEGCDAVGHGSGFMEEDSSCKHDEQNAAINAVEADLAEGDAQCSVVFADPGGDDQKTETDAGEEENTPLSHGATSVVAIEVDGGRIGVEESGSGTNVLEESLVESSIKEHSCGSSKEVAEIGSQEGGISVGGAGAQVLDMVFGAGKEHDELVTGSRLMEVDSSSREDKLSAIHHTAESDLIDGHAQAAKDDIGPQNRGEKDETDGFQKGEVSSKVLESITPTTEISAPFFDGQQGDMVSVHETRVMEIGSMVARDAFGGDNVNDLDIGQDVGEDHAGIHNGSKLVEEDAPCQEDEQRATNNAMAGGSVGGRARATVGDVGMQKSEEKDESGDCQESELCVTEFESTGGSMEGSVDAVVQKTEIDGFSRQMNLFGEEAADLEIGSGRTILKDDGSKSEEQIALLDIVGSDMENVLPQAKKDVQDPSGSEIEVAAECEQKQHVGSKDVQYLIENLEPVAAVAPELGDFDSFNSESDINPVQAEATETSHLTELRECPISCAANRQNNQNDSRDQSFLDHHLQVVGLQASVLEEPSGGDGKLETLMEDDSSELLETRKVETVVAHDIVEAEKSEDKSTQAEAQDAVAKSQTELTNEERSYLGEEERADSEVMDHTFVDGCSIVEDGAHNDGLEEENELGVSQNPETDIMGEDSELLETRKVEAVAAHDIVEAEKSEDTSTQGEAQDVVAKTQTELTNEERSYLGKEERTDSEVMDHTFVDGCSIVEDGVHNDGLEEENEPGACQNPETDIMDEGSELLETRKFEAVVAHDIVEAQNSEDISTQREAQDAVAKSQTELTNEEKSYSGKEERVDSKVMDHTLVDGCSIVEDGVHNDGLEEENELGACQNPETDIMDEGSELLETRKVEAVVAQDIVEAQNSEDISSQGEAQDAVAKSQTELTNEERSYSGKEERVDSEVMDHTLVDGCSIAEDGVHNDGLEEENGPGAYQNPETDIMDEGRKPGAPEISAAVSFEVSHTDTPEVLSGSGEVIDETLVNNNETEPVQTCISSACRGQTAENKVVGCEIESSDLDLDQLKENVSQNIMEKVGSVPADDSEIDQLTHVTGDKSYPFAKSSDMDIEPANEDLSAKESLFISKSDIVKSAPVSNVECGDTVASRYLWTGREHIAVAEEVSSVRAINAEEQNRGTQLIVEGMENKDVIINASEHPDTKVALFESGTSELSTGDHDAKCEVLESKGSKLVSENPNDKLEKEATSDAREHQGTQAALLESEASKLSASEDDVQSELLESRDSKLVGENPSDKLNKEINANAGADTQASPFESVAIKLSAGDQGVQSEALESRGSQPASENPNDKEDSNFTSSCLVAEPNISETYLASDNLTDKANFDAEGLSVTAGICVTKTSDIAEVQTGVPPVNDYNDLAISVDQETQSHMYLLADHNYIKDHKSEVVKEDETSVLECCDTELIQQLEAGEQNSLQCDNDLYSSSYQNMNPDDQVLELPEKQVVKDEEECLGTSTGSYEHTSYYLPCFSRETFMASDLVWGKVKSHPWWPGQIFDHSEASDLALKYQKKDCFLVAYFGDKTFAWCDRSQLKPFQTNFSQMEKQSSSDAFINSVDSALGEVSRHVELGMSCSCLPEEAYCNNVDHKIDNAGVQTGANNCIGDRSQVLNCFLPSTLLEYVKALCQLPEQEIDKLELVILKAQLKAFYRSKGYFELPVFHSCVPWIDNDAELQQSNSEYFAQDVIHHSVRTPADNVKPKRGRGRPPKKPKNLLEDIEKEKSLSESTEQQNASRHANVSKDESDSEFDGDMADVSESKRCKLIDFNSAASVEGKMKSLDSLEDLGIRSPSSTSAVSFKIGDCIRRAASQLTRSPPIPKAHDKTSQKDALMAEDFDFFSSDASIYPITEKRKKDSYWSDLTLNTSPNNGLERSEEACSRRQTKRRKSLEEASQSLSPHSRAGTVQCPQVGTRSSNIDKALPSHRPVISVEEKIVGQCTPTALVLNFSGPNALPSETDITRIFSRYGPLKEAETEVHKDTNQVKVVFKRRADAEVAFSSAGKYSIFGPSLISYRLKYLPSPPNLSTNTAAEGKDSAAHGELDNSSVPASEEAKVVPDTAQLEPVKEVTVEEVVN